MSAQDTSFSPENPLRVAVVGAGPAGFYAAGHLLAADRPRARGPVRPPAHAVRAGARRRRPGPSEDQVRHAGLREDRREGGLPVLRRRRAGAGPAPRRSARALSRGGLRDRRRDRPAPRDTGRGPAGLGGGHDVRRLVQRPPRSSPISSSTSPASGSSSSATGTWRSIVARMLALSADELRTTDTADHALDGACPTRSRRS